MTAYHVALRELAENIETEGLTPDAERPIILLAEKPEDVDGFDVWEIDLDLELSGDLTFCDRHLPPSSLSRIMPETGPGM